MNQQEINDRIYFLSFEYRDNGYTEKLERNIRKLAMEITREKILADKEFTKLL